MTRLHARSLAGVLVLALCATAQAQTLERYAGGARLVNSPGLQTPVTPGEIALAPDGRLFVMHDQDGSIYRFDPSTQTATLMPEEEVRPPDWPPNPGWPPVFQWFNDVTVDDAGKIYARQGNSIRVIDLADGHARFFAGWDFSSQNTHCNGSPWYPARFGSIDDMATLPGGRVIIANGAENLICILQQGWSTTDPTAADSRALAGSPYGSPGFEGDGGPATEAMFSGPQSIATDAQSNVYVADTGNFRIRKFSAADIWMLGNIETIAGTGEEGYNGDGIPATSAQITEAKYLTVDAAGNVYFYDENNRRVRRVDGTTGMISTVAGNGEWDNSGADDGSPATSAGLPDVGGLALGADGGLYISERFNHRLRRVDLSTGLIDTVLGNGTTNYCGNGPRLQTCIDLPEALAVDAQGNMYIAEMGNGLVRKVDAVTGMTSTIAGKVHGIEFDEIGEIVSPEHGGDGGPATEATFGSGPYGVGVDATGNVYIATGFDHRIRRVDAVSGIITTIAGNGEGYSSGDGGPAINATLDMPIKLVVASNGDLYFSEYSGHRVRKIDAVTGIVTTVAGTGSNQGPLGDGGPGTLASLSSPQALAFDRNGDLLIADQAHVRLRKLNLTSGIITTVAGNGINAFAGDGGPATSASLGYPLTVAVDAANNIFVTTNFWLRRIDANTGIINPAVDHGSFQTPQADYLQSPSNMVFGPDGSLFIADGIENLVFRVAGLPIPPADSTPPVITPVLTGTLGNDGWYRGNVQVSWTVTDGDSPVSASNGCTSTTVSTDTAGVTFTCTATSGGGTLSSSVTVKRDATPPLLTFDAPSPAPNASGWNSGDVSFPFSVSDETSGVASTSLPNPVVITGSGTGLEAVVVVSDVAGNDATFTTPLVNIDRTAPEIQPLISGTLGNNGWYNSDVQLTWSVDEAPGSVITTTGCEAASITTDTAGATFSCSVTSAGGAASSSVTLKRDATPPVLTFGTPSPVPNANGWNKTNVSIPFTHGDALSGIASTSTNSPLVLSTEGAAVTGAVVVTDQAGNSATFTSVTRNIDKTPPMVEFASPAEGATYGFYQDVVADYSCTDVSLLSCTAPTPNGGLINTRTAGARTFRVTGKDLVNFTTAVTHAFMVESTFNFDGFLAPANAPPTLNLVSRGSLVPVRWRLPDGRGGFVTNPASFSSATVGSLTCGSATVVPLNDTASGLAGISFDPATATFTYNWQTGASWTGCRKLTIKLKDNSLHELRFKFQ